MLQQANQKNWPVVASRPGVISQMAQNRIQVILTLMSIAHGRGRIEERLRKIPQRSSSFLFKPRTYIFVSVSMVVQVPQRSSIDLLTPPTSPGSPYGSVSGRTMTLLQEMKAKNEKLESLLKTALNDIKELKQREIMREEQNRRMHMIQV